MSKLYFRYAAMNAGKSTYLLQIAHNYNENGKEVVLFTAAVDNRYGPGKITSRLGLQRDANGFASDTDFSKLLDEIKRPSCVLLDEAQFLTAHQVKQLHRWAHHAGVPVICFGIRSDFQGNPFVGAATLLSLADDLEEIKTICACGKKATMNVRQSSDGQRINEGEQVFIGGNNSYRQVCASCFYN